MWKAETNTWNMRRHHSRETYNKNKADVFESHLGERPLGSLRNRGKSTLQGSLCFVCACPACSLPGLPLAASERAPIANDFDNDKNMIGTLKMMIVHGTPDSQPVVVHLDACNPLACRLKCFVVSTAAKGRSTKFVDILCGSWMGMNITAALLSLWLLRSSLSLVVLPYLRWYQYCRPRSLLPSAVTPASCSLPSTDHRSCYHD